MNHCLATESVSVTVLRVPTAGALLFNWSANADPQLQEAASPQLLRSGYLQRYAA